MSSAAALTQTRGPRDTGWLHFGDRSWRRLAKMLAASVLAHAFLTPGPALLGLVKMLPALEITDPGEELIAVELSALPLAQRTAEPEHPAEREEPEQPATPLSQEPPTPPEPADEPAALPPEPEVAPEPEPAADPAPPLVESTPFADPVALAGDAASIVDSNADIRLTIFADTIRDQPLGQQVGDLLSRTPQWRDFFGPSAVDPIQDVDRVLLAGPDFRDSSEVVAVVQHRLSPEHIDRAFDALVQRKGKWIDREARMAKARADRANRIFFAPNDNVVVVAPPQLEEQLRKLGEQTRFPRTDGLIAMSAYIVKPHYAAKGTGIVLPKSLSWARLDLRPRKDGGGVLHVLAQEKDEQSARQTAALVQALIEQATSLDLRKGGALGGVASFLMGSSKMKMIESVHFEADGDQVRGTLQATKNQLLTLADLIGAYLPPDPNRKRRDLADAPSATDEAPLRVAPPDQIPDPKQELQSPPPETEPQRLREPNPDRAPKAPSPDPAAP